MNEYQSKIWNMMSSWYTSKPQKVNSLFFKAIIPFIEHITPQKICEVGCGGGTNLETLSRIFPYSQIFASDLSQQMVQQSLTRNLPNIQLEAQNAEELNYSDQQFDIYLASLCLMLVQNPQQMLKQAIRVLKSGGIAVFSVWGDSEFNSFCNIIQTLKFYQHPQNRQDSEYKFASKEDFRRILMEAGFRRVIVFGLDVPLPVTNEQEALDYFFWYPRNANILDDPENKAVYIEFIKKTYHENKREGEPLIFRGNIAIAFK